MRTRCSRPNGTSAGTCLRSPPQTTTRTPTASIEWEPAVISFYGSLTARSDINPALPGMAGGFIVGMLPSIVDAEKAAEILEKHQVYRPDEKFETRHDPEKMVGRITRARMSVDSFLKKRRAAV